MNSCTPIPWQNVAEQGEIPLLLVRHGRTQANIERRFVGKMDVPLDDHGRGEARLWAARMAQETVAGIYSSPLSRARETAHQLGEPKLLASLQELDQGVFEGKRLDELEPALLPFFETWKADPTDAVIPGGESLGQCRDRALAGLTDCLSAHQPGPPVVVVTHQMVMASVVLTAVGLPLRFLPLVKHGNTAMALFGWSAERGFRAVRLNDTEHLQSR